MADTPDSTPATGFATLGLSPELLSTLAELGYEEPTPVQAAAVPALLAGSDLLGQAATGTGKTAAFALPILQRLEVGARKPFETSALVLVPTRELALQVSEAVRRYGQKLKVSVVALYGGQEMEPQLRALKKGADVVVATPGRALDHLRRKTLLLRQVRAVVLDEADEMLDMGFAEELDTLLDALPEVHQTALFSATLPRRIAAIAERHLEHPVRITMAAHAQAPGDLPKIAQRAYVVPPRMRALALSRLLDVEAPRSALIFCRTRLDVGEVTERLVRQGHHAAALHGGMSQEQREGVLRRFKSGRVTLLVATDVAARGLHVEDLSHVINYELPTSPEVYVHRIGRTGRAGKEGQAITLVGPKELRLLESVERLTKQRVERLEVPTAEAVRLKHLAAAGALVEQALAAPADPAAADVVAALMAKGAAAEDVARAALSALRGALHPDEEGDDDEIPGPPKAKRGEAKGQDARPRRDEAAKPSRPARPPGGKPRTLVAPVRLFVSLGAKFGVRPGDLVGALANEGGISVDQIGAIRIQERHSTVEVASEQADHAIDVLSHTTLRGRTPKVSRDRGSGAPAAPRR